jgi:hypothetical protein
LEVTSHSITLFERSGRNTVLQRESPIDIDAWYFVLPRDRSGPKKGWYCLACRLSQAETVIVPYAFLKPEVATESPQWNGFQRLSLRKDAADKNSQTELKEDDLTRLRSAENDRWTSGCEMSAQDFIDFVARLDALLPHWPPDLRNS